MSESNRIQDDDDALRGIFPCCWSEEALSIGFVSGAIVCDESSI